MTESLVLVILVPIIAGILSLLVGLWRANSGWAIALLASVVQFGLAGSVLATVARDGRQTYELGGFAPPAGIEGEGPYLAISPRTPYNRYPLPFASLSAGDGEVAPLTGALDPELGFHYGRVLEAAPSGPVEVVVDAPPQLARHEGYETAFVEMPSVTLGES